MSKRPTIQIPKELPVFLFLMAMSVVLAITRPQFLNPANVEGMGRDLSMVGIMALGMTAVIITGGIDLSVASILALSAGLGAEAMVKGLSVPVAVLITLAAGTVCGLINGILVTKIKIPPIIVTLGTMSIFQASALYFTNSESLGPLPDSLGILTSGTNPIIILAVITIIFWIMFAKTKSGRRLYAVGGNEEAARLSGISVDRVKVYAYMLAGLTASMGGLMMASNTLRIQANDAMGYELNVIAAAVIGGVSISGGVGSALGAVLGGMVTIVLRNGLVLLQMPEQWTNVIIGTAIFAAAAFDRLRSRREDS
jgi:ribose transport system permease protein